MSGAPIRKLFGGNGMADVERRMSELQGSTQEALRSMGAGTVSNGVQVSSIELSATPVTVAHRLGRQPRGFLVVDRNGAEVVFRTAWDARTITLAAGAAVTVSLWVY